MLNIFPRGFALLCAVLLTTPAARAVDSFPPLPEGVTSFGAVTHAGWLYVFGGHKGERHEYCAEMVSGSFHRLSLNDGRGWEPLAGAAPGQGLPLVAHRGYVYRIGGMAARNAKGDEQDLVSIPLVQRFDPRAARWEDVVPLPRPRSSHDAVVLGDKVYVAGGWALDGEMSAAFWHTNALVLDLAAPEPGWKPMTQPFQRRALALAALGSRIYCIGGMDSDNRTTLAVEIYDVETGRWTKGPDLPPGRSKGFGCSAIAQGGRVYVNAFQGDLLRLAADETSWEVVGRLRHPRIAHRLVTSGATQLIALGGEDGKNKRHDLELLAPAKTQTPGERSSAGPSQAAGATVQH